MTEPLSVLKPKIHLCLVHNTATANIVPALDPILAPETIILLYHQENTWQQQCLIEVLQRARKKVISIVLKDVYDITYLREKMLDIMVEYEQQDIALNASGGTRPMSMAAYEIFMELGKPVFFLHPESDELNWIHQRGYPASNMADRIKLPLFLQAHGAPVEQLQRKSIDKKYRNLGAELIGHLDTYAKPLATLNWLAAKAERDLYSPGLSASQRGWDALNVLIDRFSNAGALQYQQGKLLFNDEQARFFANGGWLEEHTFSLLFQLRAEVPEIQDVARSIEIIRQSRGQQVKNELDVAFLCNNHLYIIECKTKRFHDIREGDSPGADALYKLDTLKQLLGGEMRTHVMLLSYQELSKWDRRRAGDLGVAVCAGKDLSRLKEMIKSWINT